MKGKFCWFLFFGINYNFLIKLLSLNCCLILFVCLLFLQGVCQQQNVLFDFMTVKEHLEFYAGLKEVEAEERDDMVSKHESFCLNDNSKLFWKC